MTNDDFGAEMHRYWQNHLCAGSVPLLTKHT